NLLCFNKQRRSTLAALAASGAQVAVLIEVLPSDEATLRGDPRWPHQSWHHDPDWNGSAILSTHPLDQVAVVDPRHAALVTATLTIAGRPLLLIAVHPFAPESSAHTRERNAQCARLARMVASDPRPVVVAGDFNLTVGNPAWHDLRRDAGLLRCRGAAPATYPAWLGSLGIAIDHVLVRGLALRSLAAVHLPGSDHRGVLAEVVVPAERNPGLGLEPS
nr:endonuclease/exonuclease/phosphatase family protein [Planctomycetota bacterium]